VARITFSPGAAPPGRRGSRSLAVSAFSTALDDCTRLRVQRLYPRQNQISSLEFLGKLRREFPFPIRRLQPDKGAAGHYWLSEQALTETERFIAESSLELHDANPAPPRRVDARLRVEASMELDAKLLMTVPGVNITV